MAQPSIAIV